MKKMLLCLLAVALTASMLSACTVQIPFVQNPTEVAEPSPAEEPTAAIVQDATDAPAQPDIEEPTDEPVLTPTEEPTEETPQEATEAPATDGGFTYVDETYHWSVVVPEVWNTYGKIVVKDSGSDHIVSFNYAKAYDEYDAGHVFTIVTTTEPIEADQLPYGGEIDQVGDIQVYWWKATDVQFALGYSDYNDPGAQQEAQEYGALSETYQDILASFLWEE